MPPSSSGLWPLRMLAATCPIESRSCFGSVSTALTVDSTSPRKCSRIHGMPVNCARWVTSCRASHSRNSRGGKAKRFSRARTFGPT